MRYLLIGTGPSRIGFPLHLGFALILLFGVPAAKADETRRVKTQILDRDTAYQFEDDPLAGSSLGPGAARIRVRPGGYRSVLLKPRVHFVREIFKSAEGI